MPGSEERSEPYSKSIPDLTVLYQNRWAFLEVRSRLVNPTSAQSRLLHRRSERPVAFRRVHIPGEQGHVLHEELEQTLNPGGAHAHSLECVKYSWLNYDDEASEYVCDCASRCTWYALHARCRHIRLE